MTEAEERARVVTVARTFLNTPYHDLGRVKGHGVDCATLLLMTFEEAGLEPPIAVGSYSPQWFLHQSEEKYLAKVLERAVEITELEAKPGDVVLYRIGRTYSHGAIVVDWPTIIHAHKQSGIVTLAAGDQGELAVIGQSEMGPGNSNKPRPRRFFTRRAWART